MCNDKAFISEWRRVYNTGKSILRSTVQAPNHQKGAMNTPVTRLRLGISACLLGQSTRYDGGHKLDAFLRDTLGAQFELVPLCPEVEAGFGVPREAMRLGGDAPDVRLVTRRTRRDMTEKMESWAERRVTELEKEKLAGFIFKSRSPSCAVHGGAVGLFARAFMERFPQLPVEEDERLHDDALRAAFLGKLLAAGR